MGGFRKIEAQLCLAGMLIHAVAGEAVLGEDRADFLVEVDGAGRGDGHGEQASGREAEHEAGPSGVSVYG